MLESKRVSSVLRTTAAHTVALLHHRTFTVSLRGSSAVQSPMRLYRLSVKHRWRATHGRYVLPCYQVRRGLNEIGHVARAREVEGKTAAGQPLRFAQDDKGSVLG